MVSVLYKKSSRCYTFGMNKNIVLGIVVFGGLLVVGTMLSNNPRSGEVDQVNQEEVAGVQIPDRFSSVIPVHPYLEIKSARESSKDGTDFLSISVVAEATKAEVNEWYRDVLSQNGWKIKSDKNVAGYQIIQAENGNLFTSMQAANGNEPGTVIISQQAQIRS